MSDKTTEPKRLSWAVIGGGNGGQSLAGHLSLMGFSVRLYDIIPETITAIQSQGGIHVAGAVEGFGKIDLATSNIVAAIEGADIVMIVAPAVAHRAIATDCVPHLVDGQMIFLHPGATGGALEFKNVLTAEKCDADVILAESNSLLYACRCPRPGQATIFGIKKELMVAALPAARNEDVLKILNQAFPQMYAGKNVMETSLANPNAMTHPAPTLLNTSLIESGRDWLYYWEGITPSIGAFVEDMDKERLNLARAFDLNLPSIRQWYKLAYGADGGTLSSAVKKNKAYEKIKGQHTLHTRYLLEDIPMGLVPMVSLGQMLGIDVCRMETIVNLAGFLTGKDFRSTGRTLDKLGLAGMTLQAIQQYLETGISPQRESKQINDSVQPT